MGGTGTMDGISSCLTWFCLTKSLTCLSLYDKKNFLVPFLPHKILFRVNFLRNYYNFFFNFYKTCFININIFEITIKFIPSNQTNL